MKLYNSQLHEIENLERENRIKILAKRNIEFLVENYGIDKEFLKKKFELISKFKAHKISGAQRFHTLCAACFVLISCFRLRHRNRLTGVAEIPVHFVALEVANDLTLVVAHGHEKPPHTDAFKIDFKTSIFSFLNSIILPLHTPRPGE